MKKGWITTLFLLGFILVVQQSVVYSQKAVSNYIQVNSYADSTYQCTDEERSLGYARLTGWNKQYYVNKCITDKNDTEKWCCVCFDSQVTNKPPICQQLYDALTPSPTASPTDVPSPTVNCAWGTWGTCSNANNCGTGTQYRVPSPPAAYGGDDCTGSPSQSCPLSPCPIDCHYSGWSQCVNARNCGTGSQYMLRLTPAAYGGTQCSETSPRDCTLPNCPIDCHWNNDWSTCSNSKGCGSGIQTQTKTGPFYGGKDCTGDNWRSCSLRVCTDVGTGGSTSGSGGNSESPIIFVTSNTGGSGGTTYLPTFTPVPPSPTATKIPPSPTQTVRGDSNDSHSTPATPTVRPTIAPTRLPTVIPTLIPTSIPRFTPTPSPFIPGSLTSQKTETKDKTVVILDTSALTDIKIAPNAYAAENLPTDKPLLPQEQGQQTNNGSGGGGGILVTLQQKIGEAFVTRQDEITVKRGNQFFTISNQVNTPQKAQSNATKSEADAASAPRLEINANNVIAQSSMGLSVDPLSGILTVETPTGPQKVSIMPDEALGIVMELKALNAKGVVETSILLVSEKGALIYRISGSKVEKFLGLLPIAIKKQILISADTGSVVKVEVSLLSKILGYFTF